MAQTLLKFQDVQIKKANRLGMGKKILVYRSMCDGLPCAAKMIQPRNLASTENEYVVSTINKQFELLSRCQHPNIVQYLGMTTDSGTGEPAFLVELMDRNLTEFLVELREPLSYHIEVDICHDIAKALNYLHSNGIIHCNLSPRNILLSGSKAKVDISTSYMLRDEPDCPGKPNYMPPEGFTMQYTCKLDCFSFGVLAIEIITREDLEPGPRNQSEIERRRSHIDLIDPGHPLRPIVLECLNDRDTERPSSQDLCRCLAALKESRQYAESANRGSLTEAQANQELKEKSSLVDALEEQLAQANQVVQEKSSLVDALEEQLAQANQVVQEKSQLADALQGQVQSLSMQLRNKDDQLQQLHAAQPQLTSTDVRAWTVPRKEVKILDQIGGGAWGAVAKGTFQSQQVAVKWPYPAIINTQTLERLRREVRIMAQVRHPNLLRFIAAVFDDQTPPLIITELLDMDLRTAYENGHLQNPNKLPIFCDVAYALHYLHEHEEPIIHRDVSAPNVLLQPLPGAAWKAKVSDFGSANLARLSRTLGEGAVTYTAPETFPHPDPHVPPPPQTTKIDIYSYGILLCEVATCQFPDPVKYHDMLQQVQTQWQFIYDLIISCTKQNPDDRPTMLQILDKLNRIPRPRPRQ